MTEISIVALVMLAFFVSWVGCSRCSKCHGYCEDEEECNARQDKIENGKYPH